MPAIPPSPGEVEAGGSVILHHPWLCGGFEAKSELHETLFQEEERKKGEVGMAEAEPSHFLTTLCLFRPLTSPRMLHLSSSLQLF